MDEFKMKSIQLDRFTCDKNSSEKKFGRKSARRSFNQNNNKWYDEYYDMTCKMEWMWDEIWDGDYDYYDDLDIYNGYWESYRNKTDE